MDPGLGRENLQLVIAQAERQVERGNRVVHDLPAHPQPGEHVRRQFARRAGKIERVDRVERIAWRPVLAVHPERRADAIEACITVEDIDRIAPVSGVDRHVARYRLDPHVVVAGTEVQRDTGCVGAFDRDVVDAAAQRDVDLVHTQPVDLPRHVGRLQACELLVRLHRVGFAVIPRLATAVKHLAAGALPRVTLHVGGQRRGVGQRNCAAVVQQN